MLNIIVAALRAAGPQLSAHQVRLIGLTRICGLSHRWVLGRRRRGRRLVEDRLGSTVAAPAPPVMGGKSIV